MGRQFRPPRSGTVNKFVQPNTTSSSSTAVAIPNYGITDIGGFSAGDYVLAPPDEGVRKTIFCVSSSSAARVLRFSTGGTVTAGTLAGSTGSLAGTQITFNATVDQCVVLIGINTTHWAIESMYPPTAANSTGIVLAGT